MNYYENHLDRLPLEMKWYIQDIIESDKRFHLWNKKKKEVGQMLTEKFIRTLNFRREGRDFYWVKNFKTLIYRFIIDSPRAVIIDNEHLDDTFIYL